MDSEMFMNEQTGGKWPGYPGMKVDDVTTKHVEHAKYQMYHTFKMLSYFLMAFILVMIIMYCMKLGPYFGKAAKGDWAKVDSFTQRENMLPYIGGIANTLRSDLQIEGDSLAETAMKNNSRVTDMSDPVAKTGFRSRERLVPTPEEEAMKKMRS